MVEGRESVDNVLKRLKAQEETKKNIIHRSFSEIVSRPQTQPQTKSEEKLITPKGIAARKVDEVLRKISNYENKIKSGESYLSYYQDLINAKKEFLAAYEELKKHCEEENDPALMRHKLTKLQIEKELHR